MLEEILGIVSWAVQLLLASVAPVGALIALDSALNTQDTLVSQLLEYAFLAVLATGLGFVVSVLIPASLGVGVCVWTLPVTIEIWFIIIGYSEGGPASVGHLFLAPWPSQGEEGAEVLITYLTWSSCWYSAAMWWRLRRRSQSTA
jgi:hypothetical protein